MNKWYQKLKRRKAQRKRLPVPRPDLNNEQILVWADAHHQRTGKWPKRTSGPVRGTLDESGPA